MCAARSSAAAACCSGRVPCLNPGCVVDTGTWPTPWRNRIASLPAAPAANVDGDVLLLCDLVFSVAEGAPGRADRLRGKKAWGNKCVAPTVMPSCCIDSCYVEVCVVCQNVGCKEFCAVLCCTWHFQSKWPSQALLRSQMGPAPTTSSPPSLTPLTSASIGTCSTHRSSPAHPELLRLGRCRRVTFAIEAGGR